MSLDPAVFASFATNSVIAAAPQSMSRPGRNSRAAHRRTPKAARWQGAKLYFVAV